MKPTGFYVNAFDIYHMISLPILQPIYRFSHLFLTSLKDLRLDGRQLVQGRGGHHDVGDLDVQLVGQDSIVQVEVHTGAKKEINLSNIDCMFNRRNLY